MNLSGYSIFTLAGICPVEINYLPMDELSDVDPKIICAILLSDGAIREMGTGKVTIVGMFGGWNCPTFPYQTPPFFITVSLSNFPPGTKAVSIVARIEQKKTGLVIGNVGAQIGFPDGTPIDRNSIVDLPLPVPGIQIPQPGAYRVVILANDLQLDERHVLVNLAKPPTIAPQFPPPQP
jgi:hypothetical protein